MFDFVSKTDASCDSKLSSRWKIKTQRINSDISQQHRNLLQQQALDEAVRTKPCVTKTIDSFFPFLCVSIVPSLLKQRQKLFITKSTWEYFVMQGGKGQNHETDDAIFCTLVALSA